MEGLLNLENLSKEERNQILLVLRKDDLIRQTEDRKISQLKQEIQALRMRSVLRDGDDLSKMCARCHAELGMFFNRGEMCPKCHFRVCKMCQECMLNGSWLCLLCYKQRQLKWFLGDWEPGKPTRWPSGADLVKASLKKRHLIKGEKTDSGPTKLSPRASSEGSGSFEDSGLVSGASTENTPEHRRTDSIQSQLSVPSSTISNITDKSSEEADIDDIVATHRSHSSGRGNLLSTIAGSRESILSVYSNAGEVDYGKIPVTGEILLGMDYNYRTGTLEVLVKQCKELAPADTRRNRSDPYVKTYLLPDKTRGGKRKTRIQKNTLNPIFEQTLRYLISKSELENRTLSVTVWHNDRFGRNDFLGEVSINFDYFRFGDSAPKWYTLQEKVEAHPTSNLTYKGDLFLSLRYVPPENVSKEDVVVSPSKKKIKKGKSETTPSKGQLHVKIKEARNLTAIRTGGYSDPFVKGYLLPDKHRQVKQKTPVIKRNCNPTWNHTFIFDDVKKDDLKDRCLELTVWDYDKITSNEFLGGIRLNQGVGRSHGKTVDWMDAHGEEISLWQAMMDRPDIWIDGALILRPNMEKRKF